MDYTIEFLAEAGVQEIFVFCCAHANQIKKHLRFVAITSAVKLLWKYSVWINRCSGYARVIQAVCLHVLYSCILTEWAPAQSLCMNAIRWCLLGMHTIHWVSSLLSRLRKIASFLPLHCTTDNWSFDQRKAAIKLYLHWSLNFLFFVSYTASNKLGTKFILLTVSCSQSKWTSSRSPCDVKTVVAEDCLSLGDALREIDRQVLSSFCVIVINYNYYMLLINKQNIIIQTFVGKVILS